jgi:hypothetical protein
MDRLSCTYSWRTVLGAVDVAAGDGLADRGRRHRVLVPSRRDRQIAFIEELGAMPDLWAQLLAEHVPDPSGTRCRACTTAGTGSPGAAWPCRIRDVADAAVPTDRSNGVTRWHQFTGSTVGSYLGLGAQRVLKRGAAGPGRDHQDR